MENETSPTLAGPSQTNQNNLLVDSSRLLALFVEKDMAVEAVEAAEAAEEVEGAMILTTTPTPLLPKLQTENSTGKNPQFSQEIEK